MGRASWSPVGEQKVTKESVLGRSEDRGNDVGIRRQCEEEEVVVGGGRKGEWRVVRRERREEEHLGRRGEAAAPVMAMASMVGRVGKEGWEWVEERRRRRNEVGFGRRFQRRVSYLRPFGDSLYAKILV